MQSPAPNSIVRGVVVASLLAFACSKTSTTTASSVSAGSGDGGVCGTAFSQWPEADTIFRNDAAWIGSDAAYSIDLAQGGAPRILWLFGDTFIAKDASRSRSNAWFIRNSAGIQTGSSDPSSPSAKVAFAWKTSGGQASSFVPESGDHWFWPLSGIRLPSRLVLFFLEEESTGAGGSFGFRSVRTHVFFVDNPDADPASWSIVDGNLPAFSFPVAFGAAVARDGDFVYAFGDQEPGDHSVYVARFSTGALDAGDATRPLVFSNGTWSAPAAVAPTTIFPSSSSFDNPPTEFSVQKRADGSWLAIHTTGFGSTQIAARTAPAPEGPWTSPCPVFTPPEASDTALSEYAAKGHAELTGGSVVATYATNSSAARVASDMNVYFPRFVRVP